MQTKTFTVDAVGDPEPILVSTVCHAVDVFENGAEGTQDFLIYGCKSDTPVRYPAGSRKRFQKASCCFFMPGDVVAYVAAVSGVMTFAQEEE